MWYSSDLDDALSLYLAVELDEVLGDGLGSRSADRMQIHEEIILVVRRRRNGVIDQSEATNVCSTHTAVRSTSSRR